MKKDLTPGQIAAEAQREAHMKKQEEAFNELYAIAPLAAEILFGRTKK